MIHKTLLVSNLRRYNSRYTEEHFEASQIKRRMRCCLAVRVYKHIKECFSLSPAIGVRRQISLLSGLKFPSVKVIKRAFKNRRPTLIRWILTVYSGAEIAVTAKVSKKNILVAF